ncbi:MAG: hypothetical protein WDM96_06505 [Lacunisphaera sp.]
MPVIALGVALLAGRTFAETAAPAVTSANPLLTESTLPYQLPPFDLIKDEHFAPAFAQGMAEHLREIDAIAKKPRRANLRQHHRRPRTRRRTARARRHRLLHPVRRQHESAARQARDRDHAETRGAQRCRPPQPRAVRPHPGSL